MRSDAIVILAVLPGQNLYLKERAVSISKVFDPWIYTVIGPPWKCVDLSITGLPVAGQSPPFPALSNGPVGRLTFPVAGALDDDLVAGVGQPVESAVCQDGVLEEAQPFVHGPVAGDDEAGHAVAVEDQLIKVSRLRAVKRCRPKSSRMSRSGDRKDRKVRSTELSTLAWFMALKKWSA